jgi:methionine-rich copper-binding protein CopC
MSPDLALPRRSSLRRVLVVLAGVLALLAGGLRAAPGASAAVGVPASFLDQSYSASSPPSADKPQSKLWFADGSWWALMVAAGGTATYIHRLMPDHTWQKASTAPVDSRPNSTGDALWSPSTNQVWVVSRITGGNAIVDRFTYDSAGKSWALDSGFPKTIQSGGSESATIDQDSTGRFWVTWTRASTVWVTHSTDATGSSWVAPFKPAVADTTLKADDISALLGFGTSIGVLYSDQQSGGFHFAIHDDGAPDTSWRSEDVDNDIPNFADDHINLKQLAGDPQGRVFAAIKTSANDPAGAKPSDPLTGVLIRTPDANGVGTWSFAVTGTVADDQTRPMIMIDATNQRLYYFATAPQSGGDIIYKSAPLSDVQFAPGRGSSFVDVQPLVNNASGAKEPVTGATGMVVLASAQGQQRYAHAEMALAPGGMFDAPAPDPAPSVQSTSPAANASGVALGANVTATFSEDVQGVDDTTFTLGSAAGSVSAAVSYDAATRTATLDPDADLVAGTRYTATLSGGIHDGAGQALSPSPFTWSFTAATGSTSGPSVTQTTPADGATAIAVSATVTATFSTAVQGVDNTTFTLTPAGSTTAVPAAVTHVAGTNRWVLDPTAKLHADTRYTAALSGGIQDSSGGSLTPTSWTFLTGPAPKVSAKTPAAGATGVNRTNPAVSVTFNEAVQGVGDTTFTLQETASGAAVATAVVQVAGTNRYTVTPNGALKPRTRYTVTVTGGSSGIQDLAGNPLKTVTWKFTTGA